MSQFYDRILKRKVSFSSICKEKKLLLGRWMLVSYQGTESENETLEFQENLIPNSKDQFVFRNKEKELTLHFSPNQLPSENEILVLREIITEFEEAIEEERSWECCSEISPLLRNIDAKVNLLPFEEDILKWLYHIEEICRVPHIELTRSVENTPISRVKCISVKAIDHLAAHSEDWERRTYRSVIPKRILAEVVDDLLDIYENRVTSRLIDHMIHHIHLRLQKDIKSLQDFLEILGDILKPIDPGSSHWRKNRRLYELFSYSPDLIEGNSSTARKTQSTLENLVQRIRGLISSPLYSATPRNIKIGASLKPTNLLVNDQHYRFVRLLWQNWLKSFPEKSEDRIVERNKVYLNDFNRYILLLVFHALKNLGFNSIDQDKTIRESLEKNSPLALSSVSLGKIILSYHSDQTISLEGKVEKLQIVPVPACLEEEVYEKCFFEDVELSFKKQDPQVYTFILYYGSSKLPNEVSENQKNRVNVFPIHMQGKVAWISVSPEDVYACEKISQGILWWIVQQLNKSYPSTIDIPFSLWPELREKLNETSKMEVFEKKHEVIIYDCLDKSEMKDLEQVVRTFSNQCKLRKAHSFPEEQILSFLESIKRENNYIKDRFYFCPSCLDKSKGKFESFLKTRSFRYQCSECDSEWGQKHCSSCKKKFPYLKPKFTEDYFAENNSDLSFTSQYFGRDLFCLPIKKGSKLKWSCPYCCEVV